MSTSFLNSSVDSLRKTDAPLKDAFNRVLHDFRISVTDRCNLRCPYCMPEDAPGAKVDFCDEREYLTFDEMVRIIRAASALGVSKIRVTGGEPLLRPNLSDLIRRISEIPGIDDLALTTNGILLPQYASALKSAGLKRITLSLDALDEHIFHKLSGYRGILADVLKGLGAAERAGFESIKINAVIQKGVNENDIMKLAEYFRGTAHTLRFIEFMDVGNVNAWREERVVPSSEILKRIHAAYPLVALEPNYQGEVAARYAYRDGQGEIGFVSSVSQPFCGDCSRLRLSPDGMLYSCLFAENGVDAKPSLRESSSEEEIEGLIRNVWQSRDARYSELRSQLYRTNQKRTKIEMYKIGG